MENEVGQTQCKKEYPCRNQHSSFFQDVLSLYWNLEPCSEMLGGSFTVCWRRVVTKILGLQLGEECTFSIYKALGLQSPAPENKGKHLFVFLVYKQQADVG